jgi:hypothetical protein
MSDITKLLSDNGFDVVEGYDRVMAAIQRESDGSTAPLCSGYRVFPDGTECKGCNDCTKARGEK